MQGRPVPRDAADSFNGAFEQFGHVQRIRSSREKRKQNRLSFCPYKLRHPSP